MIIGQSPVMHAQLLQRVSQNEWSLSTLFETDIPAISRK